jgi:hypothetical protein
MQKGHKITIIILSIMLCISLSAVAVLSGTLTKYVSVASSRALARVAKWGIDINAGSDLVHTITDGGDYIYLKAKNQDNSLIPGTRGSFAYFKTEGAPEVAYKINIDGKEETVGGKTVKGFTVGEGFYASSRLVRGEDGLPVEYFPLIISVRIYDLSETGTKTHVRSASYAIKSNISGVTSCNNLADLVTKVNEAIDGGLDVNDNPPTGGVKFNRVYTLDWEWIYEPAKGSYQTNYLDTALCEAVLNNEGKFDISVNMAFEIVQLD